MSENIILYDALSLTSRIDSPQSIIELLGLQSVTWETVKGAHGYQDRLYWNCISIHFNGREDMGVWLELTGQGCRAFETYGNGNYERLFDYAIYNSGEVNITRLDVAFDDHAGVLDIKQLAEDTRKGEYVSKFRKSSINEEFAEYKFSGTTVYHGSSKSEILIRIYDKAAERGYEDGRHWIRTELQLRRDRALSFIRTDGDLGYKFSGVLSNYLRYVDPVPGDTNKWRWSMKHYWQRLLCSSERIKLYKKPGIEYNIENLDNFVFQQAGNATAAMIAITGVDGFVEKLRRRGTMPNPKYDRLVSLYGRKVDAKDSENKND